MSATQHFLGVATSPELGLEPLRAFRMGVQTPVTLRADRTGGTEDQGSPRSPGTVALRSAGGYGSTPGFGQGA